MSPRRFRLPEPDVPVALPELLVTGRSQNSDIQRTENDIQAYKVWSSRDIQQAHSADLNEFLRVMATGDAQIASALQDPSNTNASTRSEVNLRGMGSNQTLVLVDGRRMPGLPPAGGQRRHGQPDRRQRPAAGRDRPHRDPQLHGGRRLRGRRQRQARSISCSSATITAPIWA
jgi:iron complex outermembrane receptor protein